jgi:hypothetical protein
MKLNILRTPDKAFNVWQAQIDGVNVTTITGE